MKNLLIFILNLYQKWISPFLGQNCRFYPTCSQYAIDVLKKCGLITGIFLILKRILKCHPFHPGGYNPL